MSLQQSSPRFSGYIRRLVDEGLVTALQMQDAVEKANPGVFPQRFRGMGRGNGKDGQGASRQQNPRGDHHQFEVRGPLHVQAAVFGKKAVCQA